MIIDKLENNTKIKLIKVVTYVKLMYAYEILDCKAFKTREFARKFVEGGSRKQYSFLWSYYVKLMRASIENTFKLNID